MVANIWSKNLATLEVGLDLEPDDVQWCMREILEGRAETIRIKEFLLALKSKGETSDEVGALVTQMYEHCAPITIRVRAVDTVGTGGDGAHTINISTTSAIIAGLIPTALGLGIGGAQRSAIAVTIIGGQSLCLFLTLLLVPAAYAKLDALEQSLANRRLKAWLDKLRSSTVGRLRPAAPGGR